MVALWELGNLRVNFLVKNNGQPHLHQTLTVHIGVTQSCSALAVSLCVGTSDAPGSFDKFCPSTAHRWSH